MTSSPFNPPLDASIASAAGSHEAQAFVARYSASPAAAATDDVLAAVTDDGTEQTITTGITDPDIPRVVTATAGGTTADIAAIQVVVNGTNAAGDAITETLPAFTVNTAGTVTGTKAFKTVTSVVIPAHDGTGATTEIGTGSALGLNHRLTTNTVLPGVSSHDATIETTDPTVTVSASALESNTITFDTALDGSAVDAYYLVTPAA